MAEGREGGVSCHPRHDIQLGHFPQGKGATTLTEITDIPSGDVMSEGILEMQTFVLGRLSLHPLNFGGDHVHLGMARYGQAETLLFSPRTTPTGMLYRRQIVECDFYGP